MSAPITLERLRQVVTYDPITGIFTWRIGRKRCAAGSIAGFFDKERYWQIGIDRRMYRAHRLAFLYMNGEWPKGEVDHINGIRHDNRWCNIREATRPQQLANSKVRKDNSSGFRGIRWRSDRRRWSARINDNGKQIHLGHFKTKEAAVAAYDDAAEKIFGSFRRLA